MSAFQKLFLASAILATGLAVAILLGQPVVRSKTSASASQQPPQPIALSSPAASATTAYNVASARLIPDVDAPLKTTNTLDAPALLAPLAATSSCSTEWTAPPASQLTAVANLPAPRAFETNGPVVHLRNEAPRAIGNEPRSPLTVRRLPPVEGQSSFVSAGSEPSRITSVWATPPAATLNQTSAAIGNNTPAMPAAFTNSSLIDENHPAPPPPAQFTADDADDSHTHVVADGDSLEKIAALYLSDPQRGKEIYELNRDVLSDPNLLPIGAELKIPDRASRTSWDRQSRLPGFQGDATIRQAANGDLVPVRSLPDAGTAIPPHAQLSRPIAAD